jgi:2-dehydropantoate 2-reductase
MRVAVFGAGAVGSYFGGRLAQAGHSVAFVARGKAKEALRRAGLRVSSIAGDFEVKPAEASDTPAEIGVVDVVLVGVKAWQVGEAAAAMLPIVGPQTLVVPLLNGVLAHDQLAEALGAERVLGGLCRILAFQVEPGHVRHAGVEPSIAFGEWRGGASERVLRLKAAFDGTVGVTAQVPPNIQTAVWEKFLFIAPVGGVGAVTRAPAGVYRALPETRALLEGMMREVLAVAVARGVPMRDGIVERTLAFVDTLPPSAHASMVRDILDGRPSELEAQNGAVARLGASAGVAVPLNTFAYHALLPQERRARGELAFPA